MNFEVPESDETGERGGFAWVEIEGDGDCRGVKDIFEPIAERQYFSFERNGRRED